MRTLLSHMWHEQDGVLSFEWTMLASLLTIGTVAGLASVRDGVIDEMGDLTRSITSLDQSYRIQGPLVIGVHTPAFGSGARGTAAGTQGAGVLSYGGSSAAGSMFLDSAPQVVRGRLPADETVPTVTELPADNQDGEATGNILEQ
ncbi:MAG: hypothetical protein IAF94_23225 [Pirellulaceae bacterium]|nr:hypothetical protein [Pirellulaceae bacterium]